MSQNKQLSILEFSRLTGIRRENLRFYDRIGLLCPETRGENNYRYYSRHQLNTAYLISDLRGLGVGIEDIKRHCTQLSPEKTLTLLTQQDARIRAEIARLQETRLIMRIHSDMVRASLTHGEDALFLEEKAQEPIFLCPPAPPDADEDEGGIFSYRYAERHGVNLSFPQGTMIAQAWLESTDCPLSDQYYFKLDKGGNAHKPAGRYAVTYGRCDPWKSEPLYLRLLDFIRTQGLIVCGDAYEEYSFGDAIAQREGQYCVRVEIPVAAPEPD